MSELPPIRPWKGLNNSHVLAATGEWVVPAGGGGAPDPHAASHATGGSDELTPADIGAAPLAMDPQTLRGNNTLSVGSGLDLTVSQVLTLLGLDGLLMSAKTITVDKVISAGYSAYVTDTLSIATGKTLEIGSGSSLEIG